MNDSKATNVDSVRYALQSYDAPIVLIAGGKDKGSDFSVLAGLVREHVKAVILIGQAAGKMEAAFRGATRLERASSLHEAVLVASRIAAAGDVVLLSPACASFDMFRDFEDRGRKFKSEVESLVGPAGRGRRGRAMRARGAVRCDRSLIWITAVLVLVGGMLTVYTASVSIAERSFGGTSVFMRRNVLRTALGLIAMLVAYNVDYRSYRKHARKALFGAIALLSLTLVFADPVRGVKGFWLMFQPSELAKLALVVDLADVLAA